MKSWTPILFILLQVVGAARPNVEKSNTEKPITEKSNPEIEEATFLVDFKWHNPFHRDEDIVTRHFDPDCEATGTVHAMQYKFKDLDVDLPGGLAPWKDALQPFLARDYLGSWEAIDPGGANRDLLMMEYHDVPAPVREWVEEQHRIPYNDKIWLMGIFGKPKTPEGGGKPVADAISADKFDEVPAKDKVLIFAPGAMYEILPLFVAKNAKSPGCEGEYLSCSMDLTTPARPVYADLMHSNQPSSEISRSTKAMKQTTA